MTKEIKDLLQDLSNVLGQFVQILDMESDGQQATIEDACKCIEYTVNKIKVLQAPDVN